MPTEKVFINVYGDTREQCVPDPNWRADYARYLAGFGKSPEAPRVVTPELKSESYVGESGVGKAERHCPAGTFEQETKNARVCQ